MSKTPYLNSVERKKLRRKLFTENPNCFHCGRKMKLGAGFNGEMDLFATIEHLVPRRDGGSNKESNIVLVHKKCNI